MQGQLAEHPLAELIREINRARLSGALRLSRDRAKAVIYFDGGELILAASNVRAHRLREALKRHGLTDEDLSNYETTLTDEELARQILASAKLTKEALDAIRTRQAGDVLRVTLLWTDGIWQFDDRVRLAAGDRVPLDVSRFLLECARHLPFAFVQARFNDHPGNYSFRGDASSMKLLPVEATVMSRAAAAGTNLTIEELTTNGKSSEDSLRSIYALSLSGLLEPSDWPSALGSVPQPKSASPATVKVPPPSQPEIRKSDQKDADELFSRLGTATDFYEVLGVAPDATDDEIKQEYRSLALRFHPDRFHQSAPELRTKIESAFANILQAYETLSDAKQRDHYDKRSLKPGSKTKLHETNGARKDKTSSQRERAEASFQRGINALTRQQYDEAIRSLAEAALLEPREARYRANYGHALMSRPNMRRNAEFELQAAVRLEPNNASYRMMLAELYKELGLFRRAEGEAERALTLDPKNQAARTLLSSLKGKKDATY
ncbi:MAG TPA: DnaJ domain-containing protein [Pyrinomonadaceae bacterium]|nr:DnaJ domain-containing protein [Pyrinomonadaceae bacterium]